MRIQNISILGGCGHIGLPLGILCAKEGFNTTLIDSDAERIEKVSRGELPFYERDGELELKSAIDSGRLKATESWSSINESDVVIVTTPGSIASESGGIDASFIFSVVEKLSMFLRSGQAVLLRSTLAPGLSEKIFEVFEKKKVHVSLGYCPERILQGEALSELQIIPQIVSGFDAEALRVATYVFSRITKKPVIELSVREAELAKFFCNVWRYINFSVSNQFWQIAEEADCDFHRIREAVTKEYPRMSQFSKAGFVGGSCLKKDVLQLGTNLKETAYLGKVAIDINDGLIPFVGKRILTQFGSCEGVRVGVLGLTFKKDSDDLRDSLSLKLISYLKEQGALVKVHDPFVKSDSLEDVLNSQVVVVATPHSAFKNNLFKKGTLLINPWNG